MVKKKTPWEAARDRAAREAHLAENQKRLRETFADAGFMKRYRRADRALDAVKAALDSWFHESVQFRTERTRDRVLERVLVKDDIPSVVEESVADFVELLRGALDHLVFDLAESEQGALTLEQERSTAFPVKLREPHANDHAAWRGLSLAAPEVPSRVRRMQPFVTHPQDPEGSPLAQLDYLAQRSKHRRLIPIAVDGSTSGEMIGSGSFPLDMRIGGGRVTVGEDTVLWEGHPATAAQFDRTVRITVGFDLPRTRYERVDLGLTLEKFLAFVDQRVFGPLLPLLAQRQQ